jgi:predicted N-acyltransferase
VEFRFEDDLDHVAEDLAGSRQRQASPAVDRSFATAPDFWSSLSAAMGPKAEAIFAERGEEILGSHVLLRNERRGEMWSYRVMAMSPGGRDQRAAQNALAYYEPIRRTIALGYRRLWLGSGGYEAKAVRGARQVPIYSYFWFPRVWDRWLLPPYLQQFGEVTRHLIGLAIDRPTRIRAVLARSAKPTKEK